MADNSTKTAKGKSRKPTAAEVAEAKRLSEFDYSSLAVDATDESLQALRAERTNEMIPHLRRSLDEAKPEKQADGSEKPGEVGKTLALTAPDEAVAKRIRSKLTGAAEALDCGVRTENQKQADGTVRVVFAARRTRKHYTRKTAESAKS